MGEFSLIKFEGKPFEKLIDVISNGIGILYKPRAIRKEAEAKAYEIEIIERAKSKAIAEGKEIDAEVYNRIQERLLHQEIKRQRNIDNVSEIAAEELSRDESVSDEPVDDDWTSRFFGIIKDVSDAEMQILWGRILAGEVRQPKSYSLRTLELMKNLSKQEAEAFTRASNLIVRSWGWTSPFIFRGEKPTFLDEYGMSFEDRLLLTETGLLQAEGNITRNLKQRDNDNIVYFESGKYLIKTNKKANTPEHHIEIYRFTKIGEELIKLLSPNPTEGYIKDFCIRLQDFGLEVEHAIIISKEVNGMVNHTLPWLKFDKA